MEFSSIFFHDNKLNITSYYLFINIYSCVFFNITSFNQNGGSIFCSNVNSFNCLKTFFSFCSTNKDGGAIYLSNISLINISNCCSFKCFSNSGQFLNLIGSTSSKCYINYSTISFSPYLSLGTGFVLHLVYLYSQYTLINSSYNDLKSYDCIASYLVPFFNVIYSTFCNNSADIIIECHCDNGGHIKFSNMIFNKQKTSNYGLFELLRGIFYVESCIFKNNIYSRYNRDGQMINFNFCSFDQLLSSTFNILHYSPCEYIFLKSKTNSNIGIVNFLFAQINFFL